MNGNIRVGNLFGIPFYINPSWFLVLAGWINCQQRKYILEEVA
jgi:hypothetical protein